MSMYQIGDGATADNVQRIILKPERPARQHVGSTDRWRVRSKLERRMMRRNAGVE